MAYGSRIRDNPDRLFTLFTEVVAPENGADGWILQKFPDDFEEQDILKNIPMFCFPTASATPGPVQHFCFVLTDVDSMFTFGFCRLNTDGKTCLCILSYLPWHDVFYKLLNYLVDLMTKNPSEDLLGFLRTAYGTDIPQGGEELHIIHKLQKVEFQALCPDSKRLPTIPENRAVTEYFNALDVGNMTTIFASLLNERRIIITSKKLGRLTACVMACNILLYPMRWQHIFVPVLPKKLLEYVTAPMPFIIGVPEQLMPAVLKMDLGEVVIVDADLNTVQTPFNDTQILPSSVISSIKSGSGKMFGDGVARSFMRALVELIGGYRFGLILPPGEKISFDMDKFIRNRPASLQIVLSKLMDQQIFRQFVDERLHLLNKGIGFSDEFEQEVSLLIDHESGANRDSSIADQYHRWSSKGGIIIKKMKDRSKDAVKGLKNKMQDRSSKAVSEASFSDRFGGSEPALSIIAPASPPHPSRLFSTNAPLVNQNRNSQFSKKNLDQNLDSLSLHSDFLHNPGLTVDLPVEKPARQATEPAAVVTKEEALISFEDDDRPGPVDPFFDLMDSGGTETGNQDSVKNLISLYAAKAQNIGSLPYNGRPPLQIPQSSVSGLRPLSTATNLAPVWGAGNQSLPSQHQLMNASQQPILVNSNWRPVLPVNQGLLRSGSSNFQPRPGISSSDIARRLEGQLTPKKIWENFG